MLRDCAEHVHVRKYKGVTLFEQAANNVVAHPGHGLAKPSRAQKERELQPV